MNPLVSALIIGIAVFLALSTGHFFPWQVLGGVHLTDSYGHLKRIPSYIYGVSMIGLGLTVWMEINHFDQLPIWGFWFFAICAGAGTVGSYSIDRIIEIRANRNEHKRDNGATDD